MHETRSFPLWAWWVIGIAVIIGITAGVVFIIRVGRVKIPPGLVEMREAVAKILDESSRIADVDIQPLVELEAKKEYQRAVELLDDALRVNTSHEALAASLITVSDSLTKLSVQVEPDEIATKAIDAFGILAQLAQAEKKFYEDRRSLYEITRTYYADFAEKKNPPIPQRLPSLVDTVNADLKKVNDLHQRFALAVKAFDAVIARK